jgi:hypothetical protein
MRARGRRITNEQAWRGAGAPPHAVACSDAVIRARVRVLPHFHGSRRRLTTSRRDAYDARDAV